jgi:hypothetical protein
MTASSLDVQVSQLPTSYRKEAVTGTREQNGNAALSTPNAKRYSIVKEQYPQLRAKPPRSGLVQRKGSAGAGFIGDPLDADC